VTVTEWRDSLTSGQVVALFGYEPSINWSEVGPCEITAALVKYARIMLAADVSPCLESPRTRAKRFHAALRRVLRKAGRPVLNRSGDRGWGTTVKWLSGLSLCVCVRMCFVGCPKVRPPLPTESTSQIVPTGPSVPPSRAHTDAHALAPNRITHQIKSH